MAQARNRVRVNSSASSREADLRRQFQKTFSQCPIPSNELLSNLGLFMKRQDMSRIIYMHDLYQKILNVNGVIMEFGVRWGQNLALFSSFRGMYEPFNYYRKIVGFDTFGGFPAVSKKDGQHEIMAKGSFGVTEGYQAYLENVLTYHEQESPLNHIRKYELIAGDATVTLPRYLKKNPQTVIALAYFDFDLYGPTKKCLQLIQSHLTKGSILAFDELNDSTFPGETVAVKEVLGLGRHALRRTPHNPGPSYLIIE